MPSADSDYSPLTSALIRRSPPPAPAELPVLDVPAVAWRDDLRLFTITWLAGFVFFLAFLA